MDGTTRDAEVERLIRRTFEEARHQGGAGALDLVRARARRDAARQRRRKAATGTVLAGAAAASVVLGLVAGVGDLGRFGGGLDAASNDSQSPAVGSHRLDAAYAVPDALPNPLPGGLRPVGSTGEQTDRPELLGNQGGCAWQEDVRRPVAGRQWQLADATDPGWGAGVTVAGFVTGTGAVAMTEFRTRTLACNLTDELQATTWTGRTDVDHFLAEGVRGPVGSGTEQPIALALVRRGDLLISGYATQETLAQARAVATALALGAADRLGGFAPANGGPLGSSAEASNAASAALVPSTKPNAWQNAYALPVTWPEDSELPEGTTWREPAHEYPKVPTAMDVQVCDPSEVATRRGGGQETGPGPVAGVYREAWSGDGTGQPDHQVAITVTGWARGTGAARFEDLRDDTGACIFSSPQAIRPWSGHQAGTALLSETSGDGHGVTWLAAQRVGDLIVSVVVNGRDDSDGAKADAAQLSDSVVRGLRSSDVPAAKGR